MFPFDSIRRRPLAPISRKKQSTTRKRSTVRPKVEVLEDRITPFTITPTWIEMGPDQILTAPAGRPWGNASGALEAIAIHPSNPEIVYVGAVNGGVWRTTEFSTVHINGAWEPLTDYEASLSIGALAISPVNGDVVFAGTGAGPVVSAVT